MTRMKYLVAAATLSLFLAGCSGSKEEVPDNPPNEIYATAQQKLQDGNWRQAITQLEALDNRYPFGPYSQQVQLDLIEKDACIHVPPIGAITVVSDSQGNVRGCVTEPKVPLEEKHPGKLDVGGAIGQGMLRVIKDMGLKQAFTGQVELQTGEIGDVDDFDTFELIKHINNFDKTIGKALRFISGINSSYTAGYYNWLRTTDQYTGKSIWIPPTSKIIGNYIYLNLVNLPWLAPAGMTYGIINGIHAISHNPNYQEEDEIYMKSWNYVKSYPVEGFIVEGQKTTLTKNSAFNRVNVRLLFLDLERYVYNVSKYFKYQVNNQLSKKINYH